MKFYPKKDVGGKEIHSIRWSSRHGGYLLSSDGKHLGTATVNLDQALQIQMDDFSCIEKELGMDISNIDAAVGFRDSDITGTELVKVGIVEKIGVNELPFGVFKLMDTHDGLLFAPYRQGTEAKNIVENKNLKAQVLEFFKNGTEGRKNKKGFLLYGPPGNGKTTEIMSLFSLCEQMKIRIYLASAKLYLGYLDGAQKLLEQDKNLFVMEEVTERASRDDLEQLLTFLDGESSWNNTVVIATTNYPEQLPANLVDRPGRFDTFIEYGNPTKNDIAALAEKFGITTDDAASLNGRELSFDYCSFIMSQAKKANITVKEAITIETDKKKKISSTFKGKMGIY